ncbi:MULTISPECIES: class I SAM-dependent methyltransferase [unclassified Paraburkholderia]|uniref:class I SAM-dependent methyltransferase n=1 Tax=unclassified Paraburkholderia TaxID=2615204 RepID=UPI002AB2F081|nr:MULTISPECIES: methyltransferase domain-containing protein [unclassified Paraburkholderia]
MQNTSPSDRAILDSWHRNAAPWIDAVRGGLIASRKLATDAAIVQAILACAPRTVIDLGCGEGWLGCELMRRGIDVTGVDAVPELIEAARAAGLTNTRLLSYEDIARGQLAQRADVVVCNFSLLGAQCVDDLIRSVPSLLEDGGTFIVQTLHPLMTCGDQPYADGWRAGAWAGINGAFHDAPPWYFRTLESWIALIHAGNLTLRALREPVDPRSAKPASLMLIAQAA